MKTSSLFSPSSGGARSVSRRAPPLQDLRDHGADTACSPDRRGRRSSRSRNSGSQVSSSSCMAMYSESRAATGVRRPLHAATRLQVHDLDPLRRVLVHVVERSSTTAGSPPWLTMTSCQSSKVCSAMLARARGSRRRSITGPQDDADLSWRTTTDGSDHSMPKGNLGRSRRGRRPSSGRLRCHAGSSSASGRRSRRSPAAPASALHRGLPRRRSGRRSGHGVAHPASDDLVREHPAGDRLGRLDHLQHRRADAGAEVDGDGGPSSGTRRRGGRAPGRGRRRGRRRGCSRGCTCRRASGSRRRTPGLAAPAPSDAFITSGIRLIEYVQSSPIARVGAGAGGVEVAQADRTKPVRDAVPAAGSARPSTLLSA